MGPWKLFAAKDELPTGLIFEGTSWRFRTEPFSHAAAWYARQRDGSIDAVGSDPTTVARAIGRSADPSALVDDLLLGFRPDGRSPYQDVLPCGSAHALEYHPGGIDTPDQAAVDDPLETLGRRVAESMNAGACLELTGGVDSRLLLALGLGSGGKPTKAFTIGGTHDPDVHVARELARALDIKHRTLLVEPDQRSIGTDAIDFIAESGFVCNAAAYGWLPTVFRELDDFRTEQLSGVGGEVGEGFYYTGLDRLFERLNSPRLWLRARAVVDGGRWASLFDRGVFAERLRAVARDRTELQGSGPWRVRTDAFYLHARIHGWALPVIRASAAWYRPVTPFLSPEYLAWSASLSPEQRHGRAGQKEVIHRLAPQLADIPYAASLQPSPGGRLRRKLAKARRLAGRVLPGPSEQPERWASTAASLMRTLDGADSVVDRLRTLDGVRVDRVAEVMRSDPRTSAHAIGALLTMAQAIDRLSDQDASDQA